MIRPSRTLRHSWLTRRYCSSSVRSTPAVARMYSLTREGWQSRRWWPRMLVSWMRSSWRAGGCMRFTKVGPAGHWRAGSAISLSGDLVTIIYPSDERRSEEASDEVQAMAFGARLSPFFGSASALRNVSAVIFGVSALIFLVAGLTFFVRANAIDIGRIAGRVASSGTGFRTDIAALPSVQLGLAAKDIKTSSGYLSYIKLDKGKWTWAQVSAGPNTGMGKDNE